MAGKTPYLSVWHDAGSSSFPAVPKLPAVKSKENTMRKICGILILLVALSTLLFAAETPYKLKGRDIQIHKTNIRFKKIEFHQKNTMVITTNDDVIVDIKGNVVSLSSTEPAKVSMVLPADKTYHYTDTKMKCEFTSTTALCITDDNSIIEFADGLMTIQGNEGELIRIGKEGITIKDDGDRVEISSEGIIIEDENENKQITGFWGKLLGSTVKSLVGVTMGRYADNPGELMKSLLNGDRQYFSIDENDDETVWQEVENLQYKDPAAETITLDVDNQNGNITILNWDEKYIDITATKKSHSSEEALKDITVALEGTHGCKVKTTIPEGIRGSVSYLIKVPRRAHLRRIQTTNGGIYIRNTRGEIEATTTNGMIDVRHVMGTLKAITTNGAIEVTDVDTILELGTTNGHIAAEILTLDNDLNIHTTNALLKVRINPKLNALIKGATSNAEISVKGLSLHTENSDKNHFQGRLNKGGPTLQLTTSNASIKIQSNKKEF